MESQFNLGDLNPRRYFFTVSLVLGLVFAWVATNENVSFGVSVLQWQLQTLVPIYVIISCHVGLFSFPSFERLGPWQQLVLSGLLGATLFVPIALMIDLVLSSEAPESLLLEFFDEMGGVVPPVLFCWLAMNIPWVLGYRLQKGAEKESPKSIIEVTPSHASSEVPEFLKLLPRDLGMDVVSLKAELHYLEVTTLLGKGLVLYNLKDAVAECTEDEGMQVHRSYWVAFRYVESFDQKGRQGELAMRSGDRVPVSRRYLSIVKERLVARSH